MHVCTRRWAWADRTVENQASNQGDDAPPQCTRSRRPPYSKGLLRLCRLTHGVHTVQGYFALYVHGYLRCLEMGPGTMETPLDHRRSPGLDPWPGTAKHPWPASETHTQFLTTPILLAALVRGSSYGCCGRTFGRSDGTKLPACHSPSRRQQASCDVYLNWPTPIRHPDYQLLRS